MEIVVTNLKYPNISKYRALSQHWGFHVQSIFSNPNYPNYNLGVLLVRPPKQICHPCPGHCTQREWNFQGGYSPDPLRLDKPMIKPTTDYCTETLVRSCTMLHMNTAQHGSKIMIPYDSNLHPCRKPYSLVPIQDPNHKTPAEWKKPAVVR